MNETLALSVHYRQEADMKPWPYPHIIGKRQA
jgi:hypothetical protein